MKYSTSYEIEDWGGEKIKGVFHRNVLIPISPSETFYKEISKKRTRRDGTVHYYVQRKSNPESCEE